jgi:hypothetical protein
MRRRIAILLGYVRGFYIAAGIRWLTGLVRGAERGAEIG